MIEKAIEIADWEQAECYLNGEWTALVDAKVPVLDRGFIFGDGVYEVISVDTVAGIRAPFQQEHPCPPTAQPRCDSHRQPASTRSSALTMLDLAPPLGAPVAYVQVTRGVAKREIIRFRRAAPTVLVSTGPWPSIPSEQIELRRLRGHPCGRTVAALRHQEHITARQCADETVRDRPGSQ